jgi:hypothetical protein
VPGDHTFCSPESNNTSCSLLNTGSVYLYTGLLFRVCKLLRCSFRDSECLWYPQVSWLVKQFTLECTGMGAARAGMIWIIWQGSEQYPISLRDVKVAPLPLGACGALSVLRLLREHVYSRVEQLFMIYIPNNVNYNCANCHADIFPERPNGKRC